MVELNTNVFAIIVAGLVPAIFGSIYYGPLFGKAWRNALGKTEEELTPDNMAIAYGGSLLLAMLLSTSINFLNQLMHKDVNEAGELIINSHFTFGHGALHGAMNGLTFLVPVIVSLGIFHKLGWKANLLNAAFWTICTALMGGILDVWQ